MNKVIKRIQRPTPKFFRKLRNVSLTLAGVSTAILTAPFALPAVLVKIAGYLTVSGAVAGAISQTAVKYERE